MIAVPLALAAITVAGVGWLYLLRDMGALGAGPRVPDALPLQRLAHGDAQPLLRLVAAWLPAGALAGWLLRALTPVVRAALACACVLAFLLVAGAALDALTANEPVTRHLAAQPGRAATWIAAALVAIGSLTPGAPRRRRAASPDTHADARPLGMGRAAAP